MTTQHETRKQEILQEAEDRGMSKKELMVLTTDPYLVGTDGEYRDSEWAAALWDQMMESRRKPLHIRGFHYWVQSRRVAKPNGKIYGDDPIKDWRWLTRACQVARYLGEGDWKDLVDMKHPPVVDHDRYEDDISLYITNRTVAEMIKGDMNEMVDDLMNRARNMAPRYRDGYQTYHTEVWCEKSSMGFVIEPMCRRYGAAYQPLVGQSSVEKVEMLARRVMQAAAVGKKVRILYIADWDRYGWNMVTAVARKLEYIMVDKDIEADVKLTRLALNEDQINQYHLPKAPKLGEEVVELDALEAIHPGELGKIIKEVLSPYVDRENTQMVHEENRKMEERLVEMLEEKLRPALEAVLNGLNIEEVEIDIEGCIDEDFEAPERDHEIEEDDSWVFDSTRDWFTQLAMFKRYKAEREED